MDCRKLCAVRSFPIVFYFAIRDFLLFSRFATFHMHRSILYVYIIMAEQAARNLGYTNQEYVDMLIVYGACDQVERRAAAEYRRRFPNRRQPDAGTFQRVYQRLAETGSVCVRNPDGERRRGARAENDEAILD